MAQHVFELRDRNRNAGVVGYFNFLTAEIAAAYIMQSRISMKIQFPALASHLLPNAASKLFLGCAALWDRCDVLLRGGQTECLQQLPFH